MTVMFRTAVLLGVLLVAAGCGGEQARVTGKVTCKDKPVVGSILFSAKGETDEASGQSISVPLDDDGKFDAKLKVSGIYTVVITPRNIRFPVPQGEFDYPCNRDPLEREIPPGASELVI